MTNSTDRGHLGVSLGTDLKGRWDDWCATRGLNSSQAIRSFIERALRGDLDGPSRPPPRTAMATLPIPDTAPMVRMTIGFTASEARAVASAAAREGFDFSRWVIAAVRAALLNAPTYGQAEVEAVVQSNLALMRVLRELAALRNSLDAADVSARLTALEREIRAHVQTAGRAMGQGAQRWQLL